MGSFIGRAGRGAVLGLAAAAAILLSACGSGGSGGAYLPARSFLMGTTPFFMTPTTFPDWRFEHLEDLDLLSIHADDFWGVPWQEFRDQTAPPAAWIAKWSALAADARATGKTLYLALSPLGGRKTLAPRVDANGEPVPDWAPVDADGCYPFATDGAAADYRTAYIRYVSYLIGLLQPAYVSPAIEINIPFTQCSTQKAAWIAWYTDVHNALKAAFPALVMFPSFQLEHLYGISDAQAACAPGTSLADCFGQRLAEALTIPGDRIALSSYPILWKFVPDYAYSYPPDTYARVKAATARRIWIAETGWAAVKVLQSYPHGGVGSCGADLIPDALANTTEQATYLRWLLSEAQAQQFEAVVWWLHRDVLDGAVATTCPCDPAASDTCVIADLMYGAGGASGELTLRFFGNMALREYQGGPRAAHGVWRDYLSRRWRPAP